MTWWPDAASRTPSSWSTSSPRSPARTMGATGGSRSATKPSAFSGSPPAPSDSSRPSRNSSHWSPSAPRPLRSSTPHEASAGSSSGWPGSSVTSWPSLTFEAWRLTAHATLDRPPGRPAATLVSTIRAAARLHGAGTGPGKQLDVARVHRLAAVRAAQVDAADLAARVVAVQGPADRPYRPAICPPRPTIIISLDQFQSPPSACTVPGSLVVGPSLEDAVLNQVVEPLGEHLPGDAEVRLDPLEAVDPDQTSRITSGVQGSPMTSSVRAIEHAFAKFVRCMEKPNIQGSLKELQLLRSSLFKELRKRL